MKGTKRNRTLRCTSILFFSSINSKTKNLDRSIFTIEFVSWNLHLQCVYFSQVVLGCFCNLTSSTNGFRISFGKFNRTSVWNIKSLQHTRNRNFLAHGKFMGWRVFIVSIYKGLSLSFPHLLNRSRHCSRTITQFFGNQSEETERWRHDRFCLYWYICVISKVNNKIYVNWSYTR